MQTIFFTESQLLEAFESNCNRPLQKYAFKKRGKLCSECKSLHSLVSNRFFSNREKLSWNILRICYRNWRDTNQRLVLQSHWIFSCRLIKSTFWISWNSGAISGIPGHITHCTCGIKCWSRKYFNYNYRDLFFLDQCMSEVDSEMKRCLIELKQLTKSWIEVEKNEVRRRDAIKLYVSFFAPAELVSSRPDPKT